MTTVRHSLLFLLADSYLSLVLQLIGTMVISRVLTPEETGIFAVAAVFAALASVFRDFGVGEYLIQEPDLTPEKIRAALSLNIMISWPMVILLFALAPFAARFYRSAGIAEVMHVQAVNFLLIPFGAVTMAYFRRELNFSPVFIAGFAANATSFIVSIACALQGMGYMSLAWSSLAGNAVTVGLAVWFRPSHFPWWPGLEGIGQVFHFGKFASGTYFFGQLGKGAPDMIIGKAQDLVSVGIFSRAHGLVEIFDRLLVRAVLPICMPYFARSQREHGSILTGYLTGVSFLTVIGWPFLLFMGVVSYAAIRIVYGPQWTASVALAKVLCAAGAVDLAYYLAKEALLSIGEAKRGNKLQIGLQLSRVLGLLAIVPFGLSGACWGVFVASVAGSWLSHRSLAATIGLGWKDVARTCRPSLYIAVVATSPVVAWTLLQGISEANFIRFGFGGGILTVASWLIALRLFRHPLFDEIVGALSHVRSLLRRTN